MKHTPTPWTIGSYEPSDAFLNIKDHLGICKPDLSLIALCGPNGDPQTEADVLFIIRAVNAHEELLTQLKKAVECLHGLNQFDLTPMKQAIAHAEGK